MKNYSIGYQVIILMLVLTSCNKETKPIISYVVERDSAGILKSEIAYLNDTIKHGPARYYFYPEPKNVLSEEIVYRFGLADGWYRKFRKNGSLENKSRYQKNLADGWRFWYFENGKIEELSYWMRGKKYGPRSFYFPNGKIRKYIVVDFYEEIIYAIRWDSLGRKIQDEGNIFSRNFFGFQQNDSTHKPNMENFYLKNKEIITKVTVSQPPNTKTIIKMGELNKNNLQLLKIENNTATYAQVFPDPGQHTLITIGYLMNNERKILKVDTALTEISVK